MKKSPDETCGIYPGFRDWSNLADKISTIDYEKRDSISDINIMHIANKIVGTAAASEFLKHYRCMA